jgi:general L-amino acid transport system substrate-binding protein
MPMLLFRTLGLALTLAVCATQAEAASRLASIKAKGALTCGIHSGIAGFAAPDGSGGYRGLDIDICRAVAAAIFGDAGKVTYVEAANVRQLLRGDEIDLVSRRITWSLTRAAGNKLMFGPTVFYDGQGFLVPRGSPIKRAAQLAGSPVCVAAEESHIPTLVNYFAAHSGRVTAVAVQSHADAERAMTAGRCKAYSADVSMLGSARFELGVDAYDILPEMISKEPLAPLVRQGDDQFFEIVRWAVYAMIEAEERGITSANVGQMDKSENLEVQRFLGTLPGNGAALGLQETWAADIIRTVGNYGEMFERNVGSKSAVKLDRGLNRLWTEGGLMYAPRLR